MSDRPGSCSLDLTTLRQHERGKLCSVPTREETIFRSGPAVFDGSIFVRLSHISSSVITPSDIFTVSVAGISVCHCVYCLKNFEQKVSFLLAASPSTSLVVFHSTCGLSQSSLRLHIIVMGFGDAFSGPSNPLLSGGSAPPLDARHSLALCRVLR